MLFIITWKLIEDFRPSVLSSCQCLVYLYIVNTARRVDCIYFPCVFSKLLVLCIARENTRSLNITKLYRKYCVKPILVDLYRISYVMRSV